MSKNLSPRAKAQKKLEKELWRKNNPGLARAQNREHQRARRERLYQMLAKPKSWHMACGLCLQFGHKRSWCPLLPSDRI